MQRSLAERRGNSILGQVLRWVASDVARPWGSWTSLSLVGCTLSLSILAWRGNATFLVPGSGDLNLGTPDFCAIGLLEVSFGAGLFGFTRRRKSKLAPGTILVAALAFGWFYLLFGPGWTFVLLIGIVEAALTFMIRSIPAHPIIFLANCLAVILAVPSLRNRAMGWLQSSRRSDKQIPGRS
jgi:hypothetical protein